MGQNHGHSHDHHFDPQDPQASRALRFAIVLTLSFMVLEFVMGWISNSLALMTDAAHMLGDAGALSLSLFAFWLAGRPSNPRMTYGYHRAEILGAFVSGLLICLISGFLILEAVRRVSDPQPVQGWAVSVTAFFGLIVNLAVMRVLHPAKGDNLNMRAAYLHVIGDLLGSVGALVSGVVIAMTGWTMIDPILTFVLVGIVLASAFRLVWEAVSVLMESVPKGTDVEKIREDLSAIEQVSEVHDLHVWALASNRVALSVHLVSDAHEAVLGAARKILIEKYDIRHSTIQVEAGRDQEAECSDC